jgi:hypothetical protein
MLKEYRGTAESCGE